MSLKRIDKIKRSLVPHVGKRLKIKWQRGYRRDSIVTYDAMLLSLSRHIFILEVIHPKHRERGVSYADLLLLVLGEWRYSRRRADDYT